MEPNGLVGGGIFPSISSGLPGVENNPLKQNQQNPHTNLHHHPQMVSLSYASTSHHDTDTHPQIPQQSVKQQQGYPYNSSKTNYKPQTISTLSDEDEPADYDTSGDPKRKMSSPWHRMKWTDTMVRLLIMAVYYIGDEVVGGGGNSEGTDKKKATTGLLQKKGKWKSVSKGMMEKGYYVSPQQCEDKFNDLNKRYKRVNDILGKGTACRVVENQSLLDTMDNLSTKMKEEARKLLNSKHLFFREMCAYHNSCGHGNGSSSTGTTEAQNQPQQQQQQQCLHSSENGEGMSLRMMKGRSGELEELEDEDEEDIEWEDYSEEEEEESGEGGSKGQVVEEEYENNNDVSLVRNKRSRKVFVAMQQLNSEVMGVLQDGGKSGWEKKQWVKKRVVQLEEQQIGYHVEAFEMEKQRLKWARFSSKKERNMERHKLENERRRLEIDRMVLLLRQKELELLNIQQQQHASP